MKLSIYSLKKILFQGQAKLLNCQTVLGEITILDNHEKFIGVLKNGPIKVAEKIASGQTKDHYFDIKSGFVEVRGNNEVRCLVDQ